METICTYCGKELRVGDFPYCPHGTASPHINGDECDYWDDNLGPEPIHITSWSQRAQLMKERGLIARDENRGDHDKLAPKWPSFPAYMTADGEARRLQHWHETEKTFARQR